MLNLSILVIDDDEIVHILTSSIIESINAKYTGSKCLNDARSALSQIADLKLILCDMNLPDGDGLSFMMESKKAHPNATFILMSAEQIPDDKKKLYPILPDLFLPKPFTANQLIEAIQSSR
jgi:CheY-like chemotaxis protein